MSDIEKRCVECGTEIATISDTPLCSKDCQIDYAHRMVRNMSDDEAWCPTCQESFDDVKRVCYHHNKSHNFELYRTEICENCDEQFRPSSSSNPSKYCSEKCFGEDNRVELDTVYCKNCGDSFETYPFQDVEFCSKSCSTSREFHWNWSGGNDNVRNTAEYREWKSSVHDRFNSCNSCGSTENLHAHHIVPISEDESLATDVNNGVLLCGDCHSKQHPKIPKELFVVN